jgi:hypothetical protein
MRAVVEFIRAWWSEGASSKKALVERVRPLGSVDFRLTCCADCRNSHDMTPF